jgi:ribosome-associated translation inhibitor RaiA
MKLILKQHGIRSSHAIHSVVEEQIGSLEPQLHIDQARVRISFTRHASPAWHAHIHLVTPGPDVIAEERDHTFRAVMHKVIRKLRDRITWRANKRAQRMKSAVAAPASRFRGFRTV